MEMNSSHHATQPAPEPELPHCSTIQAARRLGLAVRSVQMMVDRGELKAWKTPGGHRRISEDSLQSWIAARQVQAGEPRPRAASPTRREPAPAPAGDRAPRILLIEDSVHYQKLVGLLVAQRFAGVDLYIADDGVAGLAMYGRLMPDVLIVDILLPGIDGAKLITSLRSHPQFAGSDLIVVTSLAEDELEPYAFALEGVPVVHKPRLVVDLPALLERRLVPRSAATTV
jgi:excisionase family DNA binding protein